ncbi:MAG: hypothetical protein ABSC05_05035 [Candidatus Solibacter sp.]|jgi:hypothetical protein
MNRLVWACALALLLSVARGRAQVIEFEQNGLKYQTLTKSGVTIMFGMLPQHLHDYAIIQVAVSNGSKAPYVIRPEDFTYVHLDGSVLRASTARAVVTLLEQKGSGSDVIKLVTSYENAIYGNQKLKSTNGYEQRRQSVLAMGSVKLKAAAAASALAFVQTKLMPGESTDGAVFFPTDGKLLGFGHLVVRTNTDIFDFTTEELPPF